MDIVYYNLKWIPFNISLALLGVLFSYLLFRSKSIFKVFYFFLWLFFVPNTIYLVTDLKHLPEQIIRAGPLQQIILILQYTTVFILGLATFIAALYFFEKTVANFRAVIRMPIVVVINYLVAFGVTLGRIERVSSWYILTNPKQVVHSILNLVQSQEVLWSVLVFGTLISVLYLLITRTFFAATRRQPAY